MKNNTKNKLPMGLCRIERPGKSGGSWRVKLKRNQYLYFSDIAHGGRDVALRLALQRLISVPVPKKRKSRSERNVSSCLGITGISDWGEIIAWRAVVGSRSTKIFTEQISILEHGDWALTLAKEARRKLVEEHRFFLTERRNKLINKMLRELARKGANPEPSHEMPIA